MALNLAHMLSTSGLQPAPLITRSSRPDLIVKDEANPEGRGLGGGKPYALADHTRRRTRIWEFGSNLHCSIIGTCLTTAELRQLLGKLNISGAAIASDHELHSVGVRLAGRRQDGARFLQKALDRAHRVAITRYAGAGDTVALLTLWEEPQAG